MSAAVDRLLEALPGPARQSGGGWSARCPAHDDRRASLSIGAGDDGRALVTCHAGCDLETILAAVQLEPSDLFASRNGTHPPARRELRHKVRDSANVVQAVHGRVVGPNGKKIGKPWWEQPDGTKGLDGRKAATLPLYGSERAATWDTSRLVLVTEGEPAADALVAAGYQAVGTVTGGGTPGPEPLSVLAGMDVVLWPDNDDAGRTHMARLATALREIAASVRSVAWPDAPPAGDAADLLATSSPDAVERILAGPRQAHVFNAVELLARAFPESRWAVPGIVPEGLSLVAGGPKIGKSWLMLGLAIASATGGRALGSVAVDAGDVLYLALEDNERRLRDRLLTTLDDASAVPPRLEFATTWSRLDAGGGEALSEWLEGHPDARLVIVDTLARIRAPRRRNANLYDEDYAALSALKTIADRHRVALLVVHHVRKQKGEDPLDTVSGTQGLAGAADAVLILQRSRGQADATLHLTGRDVEEATHALSWSAAAGAWSVLDLVIPDVSEGRAEILAAVQHLRQATPTKVADWIGRPVGTIKRLMWHMSRDGQLGGGGQKGYTLIHTEPPEPIELVEPGEPGEPRKAS